MRFLQKNYEKVILVALFVIFIATLVHLMGTVDRTHQIKDEDLQIPTREPDYVVADKQDPKFNLDELFRKNLDWNKAEMRNAKYEKYYSDLTNMFRAVRCGHDNCGKIIPYEIILQGAKCPMCNKELVKFIPIDDGSGSGSRAQDSDRDGIPDLIELEVGLDPYSAKDRLGDFDNDGFVNLYEFQQKTKINDPASHPPFHLALGINRIERQLLRMRLKVVEETKEEKSSWTIQIAVYPKIKDGKVNGKEQNKFLSIGDSLEIGRGKNAVKYDVKDAEFLGTKEVKAKNDDGSEKIIQVRDYKVILTDVKGREIEMRVDADVFDPDDRIYFDYVLDEKTKSGIVGSSLLLGDKNTQVTEYVIKSLDKKRLAVVLVDAADAEAKPIEITKNIALPQRFWPQKEVAETNADEMGNPGLM